MRLLDTFATLGLLVLALAATFSPSSGRAGCGGLDGPDYAKCVQAESEMIRRYQEDEAAARERVLFVEAGGDRLETTEYDLLYGSMNECQFLKRDGAFRVVDEKGRTFSEGACRCCTQLNQEGQDWVPRAGSWRLHGRYSRYVGDPRGTIQTDYWCGVETQRLNDLHRRSIVEGCDPPGD